MNRKKIRIISLLGVAICLSIRLFCGVFEHDEFEDDVYFIKHRPTWKWRFYSPRGMSDMRFSDLKEQQKKEERLFEEFVGKRIKR